MSSTTVNSAPCWVGVKPPAGVRMVQRVDLKTRSSKLFGVNDLRPAPTVETLYSRWIDFSGS